MAKPLVKSTVVLTQTLRFGPAMTSLTDKQRAFVIAWNNAGGKNAAEAARTAGYADSGPSGASARNVAHKLLLDPRIQAAVIEDARARFVGTIADDLHSLSQIAGNPQHKRQLDAIKMRLHHAGMIETVKMEVEHKVDPTLAQKLDELKRLAAITGDDISDIVDADFEDVTEEVLLIGNSDVEAPDPFADVEY
jgi:hypothetical protein